jgi:integrase/recombinase XerD
METIAKRAKRPILSSTGEHILAQYEQRLCIEEDLTATTIRNYLSDLRHVATWCEGIWRQGREEDLAFTPERETTPTITDYRTYLQVVLHLKPNSVNRSLISLKRYFVWLLSIGQVRFDPAKVVKLVGEEVTTPRHLHDQEEHALVVAVMEAGNPQDRAIIVLLLHTGLRTREFCTLTRADVRLGKRSGAISALGKQNTYRAIPLNVTVRAALLTYDSSLQKPSHDTAALFLSEKRHTRLTARGLSYLIKKYATRADLYDVSPHDLRHRFGYRLAASVPLYRLTQLIGHDSLDTTMLYVQGTKEDLQRAVEQIAWI